MPNQESKTVFTNSDASADESDTAGMRSVLASPSRRQLLAAVAAGAGAVVIGAWPYARAVETGSDQTRAAQPRGEVRIAAYDDRGKHVGERKVERVVKPEAEWEQLLSPLAYRVTRQGGTERAFSGDYTQPDHAGIYRCVCCNTALYDAATQFHSGTGWPSFWQPIAEENITARDDTTLWYLRPKSFASVAMHASGMFSTMARSRPACATA